MRRTACHRERCDAAPKHTPHAFFFFFLLSSHADLVCASSEQKSDKTEEVFHFSLLNLSVVCFQKKNFFRLTPSFNSPTQTKYHRVSSGVGNGVCGCARGGVSVLRGWWTAPQRDEELSGALCTKRASVQVRGKNKKTKERNETIPPGGVMRAAQLHRRCTPFITRSMIDDATVAVPSFT